MCFLWFGCGLAAKVKRLSQQVEMLSRQTTILTERVQSLENQILTGLTIIPEFIEYFQKRTGQKVQISTMFVTLEGIVISTAEDAVQIREASGDLVLIPFSKITSVH